MPHSTDYSPADRAASPGLLDWRRVGRVVGGFVGVLAMITLLFPGLRRPDRKGRVSGPDARLARLSLAINAYSGEHRYYPPRFTVSPEGKPLLSWRVLILPFLGVGEQRLYKEFHLDEPWDSPHNLTLLERRPALYDNPLNPQLPATHTGFLALVLPSTMLAEQHEVIPIGGVRDGFVHTAMIGETKSGFVPWTKPADLDMERHPTVGDPLGLSGHLDAGAYVGMVDNKAYFLPRHCPPEILQALITPNGGEKLPPRMDLRAYIDRVAREREEAAERNRNGPPGSPLESPLAPVD